MATWTPGYDCWYAEIMTRAVLTFHSVDDSGSMLSFPVRAFAQLMEGLASAGIAVVPFSELISRRDGITITFDDGMRSVHENALPVLRDHGFPAHIFLTTGVVGADIGWPSQNRRFDVLNWRELEACAAANLTVECHTVTHPDLRGLTPARIIDECSGADDEIEKRIGRRPTLMAYPFGLYNRAVMEAAGSLYEACFTTRLAYLPHSLSLSSVPRLDSYYLQTAPWRIRPLAVWTRAYLGLRSAIRSVRGKH